MAYKLLVFLTIAVFVTQGYGAVIEEIRHEDETVNHTSNPLFGRTISIPHLILDTLEACAVTFPNGISYDIFPINNLPASFTTSGGAFQDCSLSLRNPPVELSGTYELVAITTHFDGRRSIQYKRFIVNLTPSELWPVK